MMLLGTLVGSIRYNSLSVTLCKIFIIRNSNLMFCLFVKVQSHMHARQHVASEMTNHASSENMVIVMFALHIGLHIFYKKFLKLSSCSLQYFFLAHLSFHLSSMKLLITRSFIYTFSDSKLSVTLHGKGLTFRYLCRQHDYYTKSLSFGLKLCFLSHTLAFPLGSFGSMYVCLCIAAVDRSCEATSQAN